VFLAESIVQLLRVVCVPDRAHYAALEKFCIPDRAHCAAVRKVFVPDKAHCAALKKGNWAYLMEPILRLLRELSVSGRARCAAVE
jgi:hypothetical protein